ncbi:MAG: hypothetical protein ACRBB3_00890 [Alphaproteobacteria bacterium]
MVDNINNGIEVTEITLEEFKAAETYRDVRKACTLHYNQAATTKASGDNLIFTNDNETMSVPLTLDAAQNALNSTNQENLDLYGIPNDEIEKGIEESQKPVELDFIEENTM